MPEIIVRCDGCGKLFSKMSYFERKFNYCSLDCYWNTTRRKELRNCKVCGKSFWATKPQLDHGFGFFCSRSCQHKTYPLKVKMKCSRCGKKFEVWPAIVNKRKFCSKECRDDSMRDYVSSVCKRCGNKFELPRGDWNRGRGNFCTFKCYMKYRGPSTLEEKMERVLNMSGIKFRREVKFKRFHTDFLLDKFKSVIECDGEYWHMMPKIRDRDRRKEMYLKSLGYKVFRFSGTEITRLPEVSLANVVKSQLFSSSVV